MVKGLEGLGSLEGLAKVWKVDRSVKDERLLSLNTEVLEVGRHGAQESVAGATVWHALFS